MKSPRSSVRSFVTGYSLIILSEWEQSDDFGFFIKIINLAFSAY